MITVPKLEMHLADACTLRCTGCNHYSDHGLRGVLPFTESSAWLQAWGRRIAPLNFSLLGGEPLLNPELLDYLWLARRIWPRSRLHLWTNGLLLQRWPQLWPVLAETRTILTISVHSRNEMYLNRLHPALALTQQQAAHHGFSVEVHDSVDGWYKLYLGHREAMEPFAERDPEASWSVCKARDCITLRNGALWKCPPLAHLSTVARRYGLEARPSWQPYLAYRPLELTADDDQLRQFLARRAEEFCGMCPTRRVAFVPSVFGAPAPF